MVGEPHRAETLPAIVRTDDGLRGTAPQHGLAIDDRPSRWRNLQRGLHLGQDIGAHRRFGERQPKAVCAPRPEDERRARQPARRSRGCRFFPLALGYLDRIAHDIGDGRLGVGDAVDERSIRTVLEQSAHEVGEQIGMAADRSVDTARPAELIGAHHVLIQRLAHAVQALELERGVATRGIGGRDRMSVVRRELRIERLRVEQQQTHAGEIGDVSMQLASEDGIVGPATFLRPLDLAVPISALDEPDRDALALALGQPAQPAQHGDRPLAISLHREPEAVPASEPRVGERGCEQPERELEPVLLLGVERQREAAGSGRTSQLGDARNKLA